MEGGQYEIKARIFYLFLAITFSEGPQRILPPEIKSVKTTAFLQILA
jgi:hypothetical protein